MTREDPDNPHEQVTVTDKRRIDPKTGEVRHGAAGPAPSGLAPVPPAATDTDEVADLKATLQRVKAEYDNFRKRSLRDREAAAERAREGVVAQLLGVLDDLDRARSHGDLDAGPLKAVADKLTGTLEGLGLAAFGTEGDDFDPVLHEAVQHEGDGSHPVIGNVMRQGYKLGEQVLRHAMVGVVDTVPDVETDATGATAEAPDTAAGESTESEAFTD